jgi:hypothetical protein
LPEETGPEDEMSQQPASPAPLRAPAPKAPAPKTDNGSIQMKEAASPAGPFSARPTPQSGGFAAQAAAHSPRGSLQMKGGGKGGGGDVHSVAKSAFQGGGSALPHKAAIESSFGTDMGNVQAYTGPAATAACDNLGAQAFAMGNKVAFRDSSPSAGVAAHEAAHVVQQSQGVQLKGGVGQAGDRYEVQADAAAARVTAGQSAGDLLGTSHAGGGGTGAGGGSVQGKTEGGGSFGTELGASVWEGAAVQFLGTPLTEELPEGAEEPEHGGTPGKQRKYSVEQYVKMWEKERGRPMTKQEQQTLARGCIGITAVNLAAVNPPLDNAYSTFDQAKKVVDEWNAFIQAHKGETTADGKLIGDYEAVLFAKLFWSNQSPDEEARKKPDENAYKPDPKTGKVDMSDYEYRAQPGYINFDYGFWDEGSQCFWHANHSQPGMIVYQSTKDKFSAGYMDFDRIIFCAAITKSYKPASVAAVNSAH